MTCVYLLNSFQYIRTHYVVFTGNSFVRDNTADTSWLSRLPRAGTPPPAPPPTAVLFSETATSPNFDGLARANGSQSQDEVTWLKKSNEMLNLQIEQLVSEKAGAPLLSPFVQIP